MGREHEWKIVTYKQSKDAAEKWDSGCITGHHVIPDHCFMYAPGVRGAKGGALNVPGAEAYSEDDAPVILLTADDFGSTHLYMHSAVHAEYDPVEAAWVEAGNTKWTYAQARDAGVTSVLKAQAKYAVKNGWTRAALTAVLDAYYVDELGLDVATWLRAGFKASPDLVKPREGMRSGGKAPSAMKGKAVGYHPYK